MVRLALPRISGSWITVYWPGEVGPRPRASGITPHLTWWGQPPPDLVHGLLYTDLVTSAIPKTSGTQFTVHWPGEVGLPPDLRPMDHCTLTWWGWPSPRPQIHGLLYTGLVRLTFPQTSGLWITVHWPGEVGLPPDLRCMVYCILPWWGWPSSGPQACESLCTDMVRPAFPPDLRHVVQGSLTVHWYGEVDLPPDLRYMLYCKLTWWGRPSPVHQVRRSLYTDLVRSTFPQTSGTWFTVHWPDKVGLSLDLRQVATLYTDLARSAFPQTSGTWFTVHWPDEVGLSLDLRQVATLYTDLVRSTFPQTSGTWFTVHWPGEVDLPPDLRYMAYCTLTWWGRPSPDLRHVNQVDVRTFRPRVVASHLPRYPACASLVVQQRLY